ncbi:response regulator, partial [Patescibacteria group bacterium]|nr:response regulator [Patescibacteria group bacterium]
IILDFIMPKMHGKDVLKNLMMDEWGSTVTVLILTNYTLDVDIKEAIEKNPQLESLDKTQCDLLKVVAKVKEMLAKK